MKIFLLYSVPCLFMTSILISQPDENFHDKYIPDLHLPDSNLQKLLKHPEKQDSCICGNILKNGRLVLPDQDINDILKNRSAYIPNRYDNMPEYIVKDYFPKMPEYYADPDITYNMPELKFPGLIRDRSKLLQPLKKHKWEGSIIK